MEKKKKPFAGEEPDHGKTDELDEEPSEAGDRLPGHMNAVGCRVGIALGHEGAVLLDRHHPVGEDVTLAAGILECDDPSHRFIDHGVR